MRCLLGAEFLCERASQGAKHPTSAVAEADDLIEVPFTNVFEISRDLKHGFEFCERPVRYRDVTEEFLCCSPSMTFRDVGRYGNGRPLQLRCQSEHLMSWEATCQTIDPPHQFHPVLPDAKLPIVASGHLAPRAKSPNPQIPTLHTSQSPASESP